MIVIVAGLVAVVAVVVAGVAVVRAAVAWVVISPNGLKLISGGWDVDHA